MLKFEQIDGIYSKRIRRKIMCTEKLQAVQLDFVGFCLQSVNKLTSLLESKMQVVQHNI